MEHVVNSVTDVENYTMKLGTYTLIAWARFSPLSSYRIFPSKIILVLWDFRLPKLNTCYLI